MPEFEAPSEERMALYIILEICDSRGSEWCGGVIALFHSGGRRARLPSKFGIIT